MKKSFLLHLDSLAVLNDMPDDFAGKFFKIIYQYQLNGSLPEMDFATKLAVSPFINQFKRDDEKYNAEIRLQSEKGKLGNLKRWHKDLYEQVVKNELNIEEAVAIAKCRTPMVGDDTQSPPIPKSLDNDSDNDNKKESKNESNNNSDLLAVEEKKIKLKNESLEILKNLEPNKKNLLNQAGIKTPIVYQTERGNICELATMTYKAFYEDDSFIELSMQKHRKPREVIMAQIKAFLLQIQLNEEYKQKNSIKELKTHCTNFLNRTITY